MSKQLQATGVADIIVTTDKNLMYTNAKSIVLKMQSKTLTDICFTHIVNINTFSSYQEQCSNSSCHHRIDSREYYASE